MSSSDSYHALIVFVITALQTWWLRNAARPAEKQMVQVYHAVNDGRMERIEKRLDAVCEKVGVQTDDKKEAKQ